MVHHLKYEGFRTLADEIAEIVVQRTARPPRGILVPIPLGRRRLGTRGYNQAAEIARALAAHWKLPVSEASLRRTRETKTQTALAPEERERNVRGAFWASPAKGRQREIILIDDVLTTGATLAAAARSLEESGWRRIDAVTFARALPYGSEAGIQDRARPT
jgi:ComF family protein